MHSRQPKFLCAVLLSFGLIACQTIPHKAEVGQKKLPAPFWLEHSPTHPSEVYFAGEAMNAPTKDEALERSWLSALLRFGQVTFPELSQIKSSTTEGLRDSHSDHRLRIDLRYVNWVGVSEAKEFGSPRLIQNPDRSWTAFRLLKWDKDHITDARAKISKLELFGLPMAPEAEEREIEAVLELRNLNQELLMRNQRLEKVFAEVPCHLRISNMIQLIGKPDHVMQSHITSEFHYVYGSFQVVGIPPNQASEIELLRVLDANGSHVLQDFCVKKRDI